MNVDADIWAVVPVKSLDAAKSRLSAAYSPEFRSGLASAMLQDVLVALHAVRQLSGLVVVTVDPLAREMALAHGAHIFDDGALDGQTGAVMSAVRKLAAERRASMLTVPGD